MQHDANDSPRLKPKMKVPKDRSVQKKAVIWAVCGVILVAVVGSIYGYMQGKTALSVKVAGADASLKTEAEVRQLVHAQTEKLRVKLSSASRNLSPDLSKDLGVTVDEQRTVQDAMRARHEGNFLMNLDVWRQREVSLVVNVDGQKLSKYVRANFDGNEYVEPVNAGLTYDAPHKEFTTVPGKLGKGFDVAGMERSIRAAGTNPRTLAYKANGRAVAPVIEQDAAFTTQDAANERVRLRLSFMHEDKLVYFPEPEEIAEWMKFELKPGQTTLSIDYDQQKIQSFLDGPVAASIKQFFPDAPGKDPLQLQESQSLAKDVVSTLRDNAPLQKEVELASGKADQF